MSVAEVIRTRPPFGLVIVYHSSILRAITSTTSSLAPVVWPLTILLNRIAFTTLLFPSFGVHTPR
jgi:hypothetical protein